MNLLEDIDECYTLLAMELGSKISHLRKQKGWTQTQLADLLGMNPNHVSRWEQNRVRPRKKILEQMSLLFGVPKEDLIPRNEVDEPQSSTALLQAQDPELADMIVKLSLLGEEHRGALKVVLRSMLTCEKLEQLVSRGAA